VTGLSPVAFSHTYWQILAGRFWLRLGPSHARSSRRCTSPSFGAAHPRAVVSFNQLMLTLGIVHRVHRHWSVASLPNNWRWMFGVAVHSGAALAIGMYFIRSRRAGS